MVPRVFITGATGYIGGSVLDTIVAAHPDYEISVLLRNIPSGFRVRYPKVEIIHGDYESADIIAKAASEANVVVHNGNSDHEPSIKAHIAGLLRRSEPSFLIHLSGTGIVADYKERAYLGKLNPKIWSDVANIDEITTLRDDAPHRNVDKIIQTAADKHGDKLKTAIICPPDIYGSGKGMARKQSAYLPAFLQEIREFGAPFYFSEGTNSRGWVHLDDLMTVYLKLVEAAVVGGGSADWGKEGYYFATSQEASQIDISEAAGTILKKHGIVLDETPKEVSLSQLDAMMSKWHYPNLARYMFASNSRTKADRAKKLLGYKPKAPSLFETMEEDLLIANA